MTAQRLLTAEQLAHYLGDIPVAEAARTAIGRVRWGRSTRWDRKAIDAALDAMTKVSPDSPAANDDGSPMSEADAAARRFFPDAR